MNPKRLSIAGLALLVVGSILLWRFEGFREPEHRPGPAPSSTAPAQPPVSESGPAPPRFSPRPGQSLAFTITLQSTASVDFAYLMAAARMDARPSGRDDPERTAIALNAAGDLYLKYFPAGPDAWDVAAMVVAPRITVNDAVPAYADALATPFAFRMSTAGYLSRFTWVEAMPDKAAEVLRQILSSMQIGLPEQAKNQWATTEQDATGRYRSEYDAQPGPEQETLAVTKRKRAYTAVDAFAAMPGATIDIASSRQQFLVPRAGAWIHSVEAEEHSTSRTGSRRWGENQWRFSAHRIETGQGPGFPDTFADFERQMLAQAYTAKQYRATDERLDRIGQDLTIDGALERYAEILGSGMDNPAAAAEAFLVNFLRRHPEACFELIITMDRDSRRERFDQSTQLTLWRLIARAGHAEAQRAVVQAATDPGFSHLTHIRALAYAHDFETPEAFLAEALLALFDRPMAGSNESDTRELRAMAVYAVGSLGHADKGNDTLKPTIGAALAERLGNAPTNEERVALLAAIGNYGNAGVIDTVRPFLADPDAAVRAGAYEALRRMEAPSALDALTTAYASETEGRVRAAALKSFAQMPATAEGMAWARSEILAVQSAGEQTLLAAALGRHLKSYPQNEAALRRVLEKNPDNRVKKEIYKFITP